ncbi:PadR family transcriptional regulator [Halocalculus aciditolerans]|uniref:PadR family transcriptional regulator n=1 Tax=Halocalculus aciditolerans TaxID=1383812 RepID=A0A830FA99_9EURY|nr:PadR family transcriptional regulator [Halocalculus aciditolerans]GGL55348.1 PadR family transcriptional regulator [Halocalculus aciditolerans]
MTDETTTKRQQHRQLTAFQKNILYVLAEESRYGLAIKRALEDYYGEEVNHGRLYPNLDDLIQKGYVEKRELDKRTNEYGLTDDGLDAVIDDLAWALDKFVTDDERRATARKLLDETIDAEQMVEQYQKVATDGGEE